jgi:hypothetical protein
VNPPVVSPGASGAATGEPWVSSRSNALDVSSEAVSRENSPSEGAVLTVENPQTGLVLALGAVDGDPVHSLLESNTGFGGPATGIE